MKLSALRHSLFLKVYLTLLASLTLVAGATALVMFAKMDDNSFGWSERRDRFLSELLPATESGARLQATVERLARGLDGDIAIYGADGRQLAGAGDPFPPDAAARDGLRRDDDDRFFVLDLPDGRRVAARLHDGPPGKGPGFFILLIAVAVGVAAYPVVRHLTRRLDILRKGVEVWGGGKLVTRVALSGKDEVAAVARSFNLAADHIEKMVSAHRALLANASHELRSPLARLRMAIDLYEQSPREPTRREIIRNLAELDSLVEEILLASRLDHGGTAPRREPVDLLALVAEEGARHQVSVSGQAATIPGDSVLLRRLIRNLMENAVRHGAPPVEARVEKQKDRVVFSVRDHGDGLAPGEGERIFEPFYRPRERSETDGGWGLGLSLVRQIAAHHGAKARYTSPEGGGACFVVEFPVPGAKAAALTSETARPLPGRQERTRPTPA